MTSTRKISLTAGVLYLLTFVSIPTLFLYNAVRGANYIVGSGPDTSVYVGSVLEIIVALAGIGTAVALYPVVKRQNEGVALGFVAVRTLEAGAIFAGVFTLLAIVILAAGRSRRDGAGHRPDAGRPARLDVHPQPEPASGRERTAARLAALPVAPGAAGPPRAGLHRSGPARHLHHGHAVRRQRVRLRDVGALGAPDRGVGVLAGRLPRRQGVQGGRSATARLRARSIRRAGLTHRRPGASCGPRRDGRRAAGHADAALRPRPERRERPKTAEAGGDGNHPRPRPRPHPTQPTRRRTSCLPWDSP